MEVYQNGQVCKYDESFTEDEYGMLSDQPLDLDEFENCEISKEEFELLWG